MGMARTFRPLEPLRGWRRVAVHTWRAPRDPSVYAIVDVPVRGALEYMERVREATGVRVTLTHMVARAVALGIRAFPQLNGIVARKRILLRDSVDVFIQVATEGGRDLSGFKIVRADQKPVVDIAREVEERVELLRNHRDRQVERTKSLLDRIPMPLLGPVMRTIAYLTYDRDLDLTRFGIVKDEFGSAMISNIATFGLTTAMAPLVPFSRTPLVVLVGHAEDRAVADDGRVVVRPMVTLGVTFDHRFMDGYQGGKMADLMRAYMADPEQYEGKLAAVEPLAIGVTPSR
jgi:pyruvate/2-oxoglutarate dehydrogenase complex dihydrolipoamide acyltransferase (E2) component